LTPRRARKAAPLGNRPHILSYGLATPAKKVKPSWVYADEVTDAGGPAGRATAKPQKKDSARAAYDLAASLGSVDADSHVTSVGLRASRSRPSKRARRTTDDDSDDEEGTSEDGGEYQEEPDENDGAGNGTLSSLTELDFGLLNDSWAKSVDNCAYYFYSKCPFYIS
jgi:hypothetical protein